MIVHFINKARRIRFCFVIVASIFLTHFPGSQALANDDKTVSAFSQFIANQDFSSANFYLSSGLIDPAQLDTGQIFYDIYQAIYWNRKAGALPEVSTLYNYLASLRPIDLNARYRCKRNRSEFASCALLNDIATGMPVAVFKFFAERGMDLNRTFEDLVPATYDIIDRLGIVYSLNDIQLLSSYGMAFGDEHYSPVKLAAFREYRYEQINPVLDRPNVVMPHNYLSLSNLNFMDVLAIALANPTKSSSRSRSSLRDQSLCQYVIFAAGSFQPSFDYLRFVLEHRENFRADQIGVRVRDGSNTADPFPAPCIALIGGMAQNHARLDEVVSYFGAQGDVSTARWLLSLKAPTAQSPVTQSPAAPQPEGQTEP